MKTSPSNPLSEIERRLVEDNLGLVAAQAHTFKNKGYNELDDLISIGSIGIIKAARSFKPELGFRFSTYATICIRREIIRELQLSCQKNKLDELTIDISKEEDLGFWDMVPDNVDEMERRILDMRLIHGYKFREIGEKLGFTRAWACHKFNSTIKKIKEANE